MCVVYVYICVYSYVCIGCVCDHMCVYMCMCVHVCTHHVYESAQRCLELKLQVVVTSLMWVLVMNLSLLQHS